MHDAERENGVTNCSSVTDLMDKGMNLHPEVYAPLWEKLRELGNRI